MITFLASLYVVITMSAKWLGAKGHLRPLYYLWILMGIVMVIYNILLTIETSNLGCTLLIFPSAWSIFTGVLGLRRLRNKKKAP